jgi:hypothetical protein
LVRDPAFFRTFAALDEFLFAHEGGLGDGQRYQNILILLN